LPNRKQTTRNNSALWWLIAPAATLIVAFGTGVFFRSNLLHDKDNHTSNPHTEWRFHKPVQPHPQNARAGRAHPSERPPNPPVATKEESDNQKPATIDDINEECRDSFWKLWRVLAEQCNLTESQRSDVLQIFRDWQENQKRALHCRHKSWQDYENDICNMSEAERAELLDGLEREAEARLNHVLSTQQRKCIGPIAGAQFYCEPLQEVD
jgi:hypothetical protein